ncbi:MAG: hypothetical protein HQK70_15705, partial [Desulfamplus sp.]|nr:hypothetical protein [Desulfamplus sp.]
DDGLAYFDRTEDQSFTYFVTKALLQGMSFNEAFYYATSEHKALLGKMTNYQTISGGEAVNFSQEPQFDDTGDGVYNIADEGNWLKHVYINGSLTMADITLHVKEITQSGIIPASTGLTLNDQTLLKAKVTTGAGTVSGVWAKIRPPQMDILLDNTGVPLMAFPKADLSLSKTEADI